MEKMFRAGMPAPMSWFRVRVHKSMRRVCGLKQERNVGGHSELKLTNSLLPGPRLGPRTASTWAGFDLSGKSYVHGFTKTLYGNESWSSEWNLGKHFNTVSGTIGITDNSDNSDATFTVRG